MKNILLIIILAASLIGCSQSHEKTLNYLALGDSYTIGEAVIDEERWPIQLQTSLRTATLS